MKHTLLTLTLAAQFAAGAAFSQTTENLSESNAPDLQPVAYGGDWPQTLVSALFAQDGLTVRPADEIATQWATLSPEDQNVIRRDCADVMQLTQAQTQTDGSGTMPDTGADGAAADSATQSGAGTQTDTGVEDEGAQTGSDTADAVTGTDVPGTTGEAGATGTTSVTPFTADAADEQRGDTAADRSGTVMSEDSSTTPINVSIAQMEEICAATDAL